MLLNIETNLSNYQAPSFHFQNLNKLKNRNEYHKSRNESQNTLMNSINAVMNSINGVMNAKTA